MGLWKKILPAWNATFQSIIFIKPQLHYQVQKPVYVDMPLKRLAIKQMVLSHAPVYCTEIFHLK